MAKQPPVLGGEFIHKPSAQFKRLSFPGHRKGASDLVHRHAGGVFSFSNDQVVPPPMSIGEGGGGRRRALGDCGESRAFTVAQGGRKERSGDGTQRLDHSLGLPIVHRLKRKERKERDWGRVLGKSVRMEGKRERVFGRSKVVHKSRALDLPSALEFRPLLISQFSRLIFPSNSIASVNGEYDC